MKVIAVLQADLETTSLGTASRLAQEIGGAPILRRTVERLSAAKELHSIHVLCPAEQVARCTALLRRTRADVRPFDASPAPWGELVRASRKWSLDGWRGGVGGTTHFDEFTDVRRVAAFLDKTHADAVFSVPPAAAIIDPTLCDAMIRHRREKGDDIRLVFTQAPPGLSGLLLDAPLVRELAEKNIPIGWVFNYKPDSPQKDLVFQPCCYPIPVEVRHATGRLVCDTRRSTERVKALLAELPEPNLVTIGRWLSSREEMTIEPLPREVEIELTVEDPYPDALLQPRGSRFTPRGPIDPEMVEKIVSEMAEYDDSLVVLGGFGDPLRHPKFGETLRRIRSIQSGGVGLYGLAVRTAGVDLTDSSIEELIASGVDVLNVVLDAWSSTLYRKLQSPKNPAAADLDAVIANLERLQDRRQAGQAARPIVVPEFTKSRDNLHELDEFHDGWIRKIGAVTINGYNHRAGQLEDRAVMSMAFSPRLACRRIRSRCVILADGRVALCDQDFVGVCTVGDLNRQSLREVWQGETFEKVRADHRDHRFHTTRLCASCDEWHRP